MAVIVAPANADEVAKALERAGEILFEIGKVESGPRGCTVRGTDGSWNSTGDWSATHNA
jgi:phosphoribosylformylglycinamidine cyclo-ligase